MDGRRRAWARFPDSATERRYRAWRAAHTVGLIRAGMLTVFVSGWVLIAVGWLVDPSVVRFLPSVAVSTPGFLLVVALTFLAPGSRWLEVAVGAATAAWGAAIIWGAHDALRAPELATTAVLLVLFFALFVFRLSPLAFLPVALVLIAEHVLLLVDGPVPPAGGVAFHVALTALLLVATHVVALTTSGIERTQFRQEETIHERTAEVERLLRERMEAAQVRIAEAGDRERRRIERNLHDGVQQHLLALGVQLQLLSANVAGRDPAVAHGIEEAAATARSALADLRALARGLHPIVLEEEGLRAAIGALVNRAPFPVSVAVDEEPSSAAVASAVYYVVAEGLANAARHAAASRAFVLVRRSGDVVTVEVADDGVGGASVRRGTGLSGMAERLRSAGGSLKVVSPPGEGTCLRAVLPVQFLDPASSGGTTQA